MSDVLAPEYDAREVLRTDGERAVAHAEDSLPKSLPVHKRFAQWWNRNALIGNTVLAIMCVGPVLGNRERNQRQEDFSYALEVTKDNANVPMMAYLSYFLTKSHEVFFDPSAHLDVLSGDHFGPSLSIHTGSRSVNCREFACRYTLVDDDANGTYRWTLYPHAWNRFELVVDYSPNSPSPEHVDVELSYDYIYSDEGSCTFSVTNELSGQVTNTNTYKHEVACQSALHALNKSSELVYKGWKGQSRSKTPRYLWNAATGQLHSLVVD